MGDYIEHVAEEEREEQESIYDSDPAVSYVLALYNEYKDSDYRNKKLEEAKQNRKDYSGYRKSKNFPWPGCANYSLMVPAIVLDTIEPRIVSALAGKSRDIVEVSPNKKELIDAVRKVETFAEWALQHNIKWPDFVSKAIHELLLDGTVYIFPYYEEKLIKAKERFVGQIFIDPSTGQEIEDEVQLQSVISAGIKPEVKYTDKIVNKSRRVFRVVNEVVTMDKVYGPDETVDWDNSPTLRKIWMTYEELKAKSTEAGGKGPYINIDESLIPEEVINDDEIRDEKDIGYYITPERTRKKIPCIEAYIPSFRLNDSDEPDWVIITITEQTHRPIRKQYMKEVYFDDNKPVKRLVVFPDGHKQYGEGIPHKIRHHSKAMNDLLNQMIDSSTIQISPFFFYNPGVLELPNELEIQPGGVNPVVGDPRNIYFPQLGVTAQVFVEYINLVTAFLERLLAVSSYASGVQDITMGQGAGTAAGMRMILQEGQMKHNYQARPIKSQLEEILKTDMLLYSWYMPLDTIIRIPGAKEFEFTQVDVMALQGDYDYSIRISDSIHNEMLERQEQLELLKVASSLPFANQTELFRELLYTYEKKDPDRYINPAFLFILQAVTQNPEIAQVIQQYLQQKAQSQKMQGMQEKVQDSIARQDMKEKMMEPRKELDMLKNVYDTLAKRHLMDIAEAQKIREMNPQIMSEDDIKDAVAKLRKKVAKDWVEAYLNPGVDRG